MNMPEIDHCLLKRALTGLEEECGDTGIILPDDHGCFFALVDVLGHGKEAREVAVLAEDFFMENRDRDLVDMMKGLHGHLSGTRGAVAALCRLNQNTGELHYVGVGNITTRIYGSDFFSLVPKDGVVGYANISPKERVVRLYPKDILMLSSDGIREHFYPEEYPGLFSGTAKQVAANMMENLGKENDDASCLVVRYGK